MLPIILALSSLVYEATAAIPVKRFGSPFRSTEVATQQNDFDPGLLYPAYNISVPIDHFHNETRYAPHENGSFDLRYYFDAKFYKPGGPVIMMAGGETNADSRLGTLQKGIIHQLAKASNGIGVVLEHRYYGTSMPTKDLSAESLRFLATEQALADTAYFATHVKFEGVDQDARAPETPWIVYGGSYAGAFVAFLRSVYPDLFYGAIASSAVTEAIYDYWDYYYRTIRHGPSDCIALTQKMIKVVDEKLLRGNESEISEIKATFGLQNLTHTPDFANVLAAPLNAFQTLNWDPDVSGTTFTEYCGNFTSCSRIQVWTEEEADEAMSVFDIAKAPDCDKNNLLNYIGYIRRTIVDDCKATPDECFSQLNATFYAQDDLTQWPWRSWAYQYCDQWGYLPTGSGTPPDILPVVSRTLDIRYLSFVCRAAFGIDRPADVGAINKYGGFGLRYERLAFLDGQRDPWREATPHARAAPRRKSSMSEPFILIEGGVHHWDQNGLFNNQTTEGLPPGPVCEAQTAELAFVKAWLAEWTSEKSRGGYGKSQEVLQS